MRYKALIFDLDGTAMPSSPSGMPTTRLINAIGKKNSLVHFSCATGRNWPFAKLAVRSLNLLSPCIISAGTQIINPSSEKIIWQKTIEPRDMKCILEAIRDYPYLIDLNDELPNSKRIQKDSSFVKPIFLINIKTVAQSVSNIICNKINKLRGVVCVKAISQTKGYFDLHVTHKDATKENAVEVLCDLLNIEKNDTIGVGDGHNDIHLFNSVDYKVAMGNAVDELKSQADLIIASIDHDGLACFIEGLH